METGARERDDASARQVSLLAAAASAFFFVVYLRRLCPTLSLTGDSAELVTASALWGVPHAPGYPLFTLLGHAATWLPFHELPWRVHLTSALFHAGAVGATTLATFSITKRRVPALAAGVALGLDRSFFLGSLYAEVFPLNDLLFASLLLLAIRVRARQPSPVAFALVAGIAASHHMMIALAAPALAVLLWRPIAESRATPRSFALLAAFVAPVVLAYALVPFAASRDPALSWGDVHDVRSLIALVTRSDYGGVLHAVHGNGSGTGAERIVALGGLLSGGLGAVTLLVAAGGAVDLLRGQRVVGVALLLGALVSGPLFAWMNALGTGTEEALAFFERFTTMCVVPIAIAFGAGVAAASRALPTTRVAAAAGSLALAAWGVVSFNRVRSVDLRGDDRGIAFAHDLILHTPDRALVLLSGDAPAAAALYVCSVEKRCGSRVALSPGSLFMPWAMAQARRRYPDVEIPWTDGRALERTHELAAAAAPTRAVFVYPDLLEKDPALTEAFTPVPDHLLFRLWPRGTDAAVERDAFLASAHVIASGEQGDACEGCLLPPPASHPSQETQLALAYEAAAFNHARTASAIPEARELVPALLARSGAYAQSSRR